MTRNPSEWRNPLEGKWEVGPDRPALKERFHKVILLAGYTEEASQQILTEWFEEYMKDVPKFEAMMKNYEDNEGDPE